MHQQKYMVSTENIYYILFSFQSIVNVCFLMYRIPPMPEGYMYLPGSTEEFKYKWLLYGGECLDQKLKTEEMLEIAGTQHLSEFELQVVR